LLCISNVSDIKSLTAMKTEQLQPIYMTVKVNGQSWDKTPQTYLGLIKWSDAVKIAKQQNNEVRLCIGAGYGNNGSYFSKVIL